MDVDLGDILSPTVELDRIVCRLAVSEHHRRVPVAHHELERLDAIVGFEADRFNGCTSNVCILLPLFNSATSWPHRQQRVRVFGFQILTYCQAQAVILRYCALQVDCE